jgi:hypothetical protein
MNSETPDVISTAKSPHTVEIFGEDIDINNDERLGEVLRLQATNLLAGMPAPALRASFIDLITELRVCVVKFGFVLNRAHSSGSQGIGFDTCGAIYSRLLDITELQMPEPEEDAPDAPASTPEPTDEL